MFGTLLIKLHLPLQYYLRYFIFIHILKNFNHDFVGTNVFHFGVVSIMFSSALMIYFIMTHHFEYNYIWGHSSTDLSPSLLFSTFYAGQEEVLHFGLCSPVYSEYFYCNILSKEIMK